MLRSFLLGIFGLLCTLFFQISLKSFDICTLALVGLFWIAYLAIFINLINSLTLKMLNAICVTKGMTPSALHAYCDEEINLESRLKSMVSNEFITKTENSYRLTRKSMMLVKLIYLIRQRLNLIEVG
jgi:hypothetical protein